MLNIHIGHDDFWFGLTSGTNSKPIPTPPSTGIYRGHDEFWFGFTSGTDSKPIPTPPSITFTLFLKNRNFNNKRNKKNKKK